MNILSVFDGSYNDLIDAIDTAAKKSNNVMYSGLRRDLANFVEEHFADIGLIALTAATGGQSALVNLLTKTYGVTSDVKGFVDKYRELEKSGASPQEKFIEMIGCTGDFLIGKGVGKLGGMGGEKMTKAMKIKNENIGIFVEGVTEYGGGKGGKTVIDYLSDDQKENSDTY